MSGLNKPFAFVKRVLEGQVTAWAGSVARLLEGGEMLRHRFLVGHYDQEVGVVLQLFVAVDNVTVCIRLDVEYLQGLDLHEVLQLTGPEAL